MPPITLTHDARRYAIEFGDSFSHSRVTAGFRDTAVSNLEDIVTEVNSGRPWREAVATRYAAERPWLHRIIIDPARTAFFRNVLPVDSSPVLEIGSGWGQIARALAQSREVVALEPVAERLAFVKAAAQQDGINHRMVFIETDYFDVEFLTRFAAICAIGVLEWAGAFQGGVDPQKRQQDFLIKTRREIAPGGHLVIGIENRLGLKYLLGCADDHIGLPAIASLPAAVARQRYTASTGHTLRSFTYSQVELDGMLRSAGYTHVEFFGAFPDYKLPELIIPLSSDGVELNRRIMAADLPAEHNGYDGSPLAPDLQAQLASQYRALAARGQAHLFVPSFFVRAS